MYDYLCDELFVFICSEFSVGECCVVSGYLMGGYGVFIMVFKNFGCYVSVFVFVLIVNFFQVLWGKKVFIVYFGVDELVWYFWDSCVLMQVSWLEDVVLMFIDQGDNDLFFVGQLQLVVLVEVVWQKVWLLMLCIQFGYDYSYYFIVLFIEDYLCFYVQYFFG